MAQLDKVRTDMLNKAAVCVQRYVRSWLVSRQYRAQQAAALYLQSAVRALIARRLSQGMRQDRAALTIQVRNKLCEFCCSSV